MDTLSFTCQDENSFCSSVMFILNCRPKYDAVTAIYVDKKGDDRKLSLFGHLNSEDLYVIKAVVSQFIQQEYKNAQLLSPDGGEYVIKAVDNETL